MELSSAFGVLACDVEVALRNTIHCQLQLLFGRADWWASNTLVLDDITAETLSNVVGKHQKKITNGMVGVGRVIGDLMLGTWVMLLSKGGTSSLGRAIDYHLNLWRPALQLGFAKGDFTPKGRPRRPMRDEVHYRAAIVQRLRNRCSHWEPIFNGVRVSGTSALVPILDVWNLGVELLRWMSPELASVHTAAHTAANSVRRTRCP